MKATVALAAILTTVAPAFAGQCSGTKGAPLTLVEWSARAIDEATTEYTVVMDSHLGKPTRMVDGYVSMKDALGEQMGAFVLPRDDELPADGRITKVLKIGALVVPRALTVSKDDIEATVCVEGVVFADGTKATFAFR